MKRNHLREAEEAILEYVVSAGGTVPNGLVRNLQAERMRAINARFEQESAEPALVKEKVA